MDRVAEFLAEKTPRRVLTLGLFVAILYGFRHLAPLLVFFVSFERALGWSTDMVHIRTKLSPKLSLLLVLLGSTIACVAAAALGVGKALHAFAEVNKAWPEWLAQLRESPLFEKLREQVGDTERLTEGAKHYAGSAMSAASAVGHFFVHGVIGLILAIVFTLERKEIQAFYQKVAPRSMGGTLLRWFGHVAEATVVTVQLQLIVAACNTLMTLPVLLLLGIPHIGPLMLLIFVSALVPVIGNLVSGTVLSLLAYQAKGPGGVAVFLVLTFVLHKVESYYLNPRLTARHVKLPGFLLIVSLLLWEHAVGFVGLFLSFPFLFVAGRVRAELLEEDGKLADAKREFIAPKKA
jgi:predicted PurR-regulated permease PerM